MGEQDNRLGFTYPADGEEAPSDGKTKSTPADLDPAATNWGDAIQATIYWLNQHGGKVGDVADRPAPGGDAPRYWLSTGATDDLPTLYYNDETADAWADVAGLNVSVQDDGGVILADPDALDFGGNLDVTDNGDGTVTIVVPDNWVDESGDTMSGDLDVGGNNVTGVDDVEAGAGSFALVSVGSGSGTLGLYDLSTGSYWFLNSEGGPARIPAKPLQVENDIQDDAGQLVYDRSNQYVPTLTQQAGYAATGDLVFLGASGSGMGTTSTTSTTYTGVTAPASTGTVPGNDPLPEGIATLYISVVCALRNDTSGETTGVRVRDITNGTSIGGTEVTVTATSNTFVHGPRAQYNPGDAWGIEYEMAVTGGQGTLTGNPTVLMWGERA